MLILQSAMLTGDTHAMHDLLIASSLVVMLAFPCFAAMRTNVTTDDRE
jgi:hypothetical protein